MGGFLLGVVYCWCYISGNAKKVDEAVRRVIDYLKGEIVTQ